MLLYNTHKPPMTRIPLMLLAGYLGAGKTTLLNALLADASAGRFLIAALAILGALWIAEGSGHSALRRDWKVFLGLGVVWGGRSLACGWQAGARRCPGADGADPGPRHGPRSPCDGGFHGGSALRGRRLLPLVSVFGCCGSTRHAPSCEGRESPLS